MKNNYFFLLLLILILSVSSADSVYSINLTGAVNGKDDFILPYTGFSDSNPTEQQALKCINPRVVLHRCTLGSNLNTMLFSNFSEPGNQTGLHFCSFYCLADFGYNPTTSKLSRLPIAFNWMKQEVIGMHLGEAYAFVPKINLNNTLINWSFYQSYGKLKHYSEKGNNSKFFPFESRGIQPANISYASIPDAPAVLVAAYRNFLHFTC